MMLAVTAWDGRIAPVFDVTRQATVLAFAAGRETRREELTLSLDPVAKAEQLAAAGVKTVLCGAISRPVAAHLTVRGIAVVPFLAGTTDEVVAAFLDGRLANAAFAMPGCCGHQRRCRRGPHRCGRDGAPKRGGGPRYR